MSVLKYVNEQGTEHGGRLFWPGAAGFPVRGAYAPTMREDELAAQTEIHHDFKSKEFNLGDPEQKAEYDSIMDRIVNGWYVQLAKEAWRDVETGFRKVYLEWTQRYGVITPTSAQLFMQQQSQSSIAKVG